MPLRLPLWVLPRAMPLVGAVVALPMLSGMIMAQECPLTAPLTVKDLHGGVVGQTGVVWTVAPNCTFTVARQIGPNITPMHKHGLLTAEQQKRLGALLARMPARAQRGEMGGIPQPNARQITLSYGEDNIVLSLAPSNGGNMTPPDVAAAAEPSAQLLELVDALRDMVGS